MSALTRRAVLAGAVAAPAALRMAPAYARGEGDSGILRRALRLEHAAQYVYGAAISSGSAEVRAIARRFAPQETAHVSALATSLEALGAAKLAPPRTPADLDAVARDLEIAPLFSELRTPEDILGFALALEEALVEEWVAAARKLDDARLLQTAASILGCQAQHLVVLRDALGRELLSPGG